MFASYNHGTPYDPSGIGYTAIPKFDRFTFNPKLFLYQGDRTTMNLDVNANTENRLGGDIQYVKGEGDSTHFYYEKDLTRRISTQLDLEHSLNKMSGFSFKNSVSYYDRSVQIPTYIFSGIQWSSFTEWSYHYKTDRTQWIAGINFLTDRFNQDQGGDHIPLNYNQNMIGAFVQNTWKVSEQVILETGVREDRQNDYGFFFLPGVSALFKLFPQLTSRIGGGLGYKTPNVFTDSAEEIQYKNVLPINPATFAGWQHGSKHKSTFLLYPYR
jgi:iron complex outermembrane receptor protein